MNWIEKWTKSVYDLNDDIKGWDSNTGPKKRIITFVVLGFIALIFDVLDWTLLTRVMLIIMGFMAAKLLYREIKKGLDTSHVPPEMRKGKYPKRKFFSRKRF